MESTLTKINEPFYPLTHAVIDKLMKAKLTAAEWKLWAYLTKLDSWGDRYVDAPDTLAIMQELDISKATFYRAISKLQKLGLFDFQDKGFAVRNLNCPKKEKPVSKMRQDSQKKDSETQKRDLETQKCDNLPPKPLPGKSFISSQTNKTYSDFIQTLSDSERESFLNFGLEKCKALPKLPELPLKWIEANWQELYAQFKSTPYAVAASIADTDWTSHPNWEDWLAQMREGVPRFVALGTCFDNKTRRAITDWALERGLIWGAES